MVLRLLGLLLACAIAIAPEAGDDGAAGEAQLPYDGPQYMAVKKNGKIIHGDMLGFERTGKPMLADPIAVFLVKLGAPEAEAKEISAHLLKEHGIETAHQLKDAVPADCADSEDCPGTLSALMNNANGSEITQNGLRFLQKEYDEKGLVHPDDEDDTDAGEFTAIKTGKKKAKKKAKQAAKEQQDSQQSLASSVNASALHDLAEREEKEHAAEELEAQLTPEQQQNHLDDGIDAIVKELVGIYEKVGRLEAMKGEEGVRSRLATYYEPGAPDRLIKAQAFVDLVRRRFRTKMGDKDDL